MIHGLNAFILAGSAGFASRQAKAAETGALSDRPWLREPRGTATSSTAGGDGVRPRTTCGPSSPRWRRWPSSPRSGGCGSRARMPGTYSVMDMGYVDYGGGPGTMRLQGGP